MNEWIAGSVFFSTGNDVKGMHMNRTKPDTVIGDVANIIVSSATLLPQISGPGETGFDCFFPFLVTTSRRSNPAGELLASELLLLGKHVVDQALDFAHVVRRSVLREAVSLHEDVVGSSLGVVHHLAEFLGNHI